MKTLSPPVQGGEPTAGSVLERGSTPFLRRSGVCSPLRAASVEGHAFVQSWRAWSGAPCRHGCFAALILLFSTALCASAETYSIDAYKIAGGGGTSTGGVYTVSGTIGQHDAGAAMGGGDYSLIGGFWSLVAAVQTPGAPTLFITHAGNTVTVYWQAVSGWSLQQNGNLALPAGWSASSGVTTTNGTNYLNLLNPSGNLFFRLHRL